ncbi:MAG: EamA family transporter [Candidatus Heimdallarchaeota archaeon]|nr:EamA family transporter [Candidatus Heimdallarchaeota archaeon]
MTESELSLDEESPLPEEPLTTDIDSKEEVRKPEEQKMTWEVLIMVMIAIISWATPNVIGRYLAQTSTLSPIQISVFRYIPATIVMMVICLLTKRGRQLITTLKKNVLHLFLASLFLDGLVLFQMFSVVYTSASASAFLLNANPVFAYLLAIVLLKEKRHWWGLIGVFISLAGIFLVGIPIEELHVFITSETILGNLLGLLSGLSWAGYTIYLKKFLKKEEPMSTTSWTLFFSLVLLVPAMIIELLIANDLKFNPSWEALLLTTFMGIFATAIGFTLWFASLRKAPVQKISVFQFLTPIIATLLAVLFLSETINYIFAIGGSLIIIGLLITQKS